MINTGILKKMSAFWRKIFLTVGITSRRLRASAPGLPGGDRGDQRPAEPLVAVHLALTDKLGAAGSW